MLAWATIRCKLLINHTKSVCLLDKELLSLLPYWRWKVQRKNQSPKHLQLQLMLNCLWVSTIQGPSVKMLQRTYEWMIGFLGRLPASRTSNMVGEFPLEWFLTELCTSTEGSTTFSSSHHLQGKFLLQSPQWKHKHKQQSCRKSSIHYSYHQWGGRQWI